MKKMIIVLVAAALVAAVVTLVAKSLGIENASPIICGAVGGAVGGAVAWNFGKKK